MKYESLLGGKAQILEMAGTRFTLAIPPGFTITTEFVLIIMKINALSKGQENV